MDDDRPAGLRGILGHVDRLESWLHVVLVLLTVASAVRYVQGHGLGADAPLILSGAGLILLVYAAYPRPRWPRWWPVTWCAILLATWFVLVLLAPSFAWCAVPLAFVALRVLRFGVAAVVVAAMVVAVVATWTGMQGEVDPAIVAGPACVALLAVVAYRALARDAAVRQELLEDLQEAQGDLADEQHRAGALAERNRLSRDIHDSVAQGLSSINLLLQAAEQDWSARPQAAREHVGQAALTARDGLDEVRRVVADLASTDLSDESGAALPAALRRSCERLTSHTLLAVDVRVHGDPVPLPSEVATALLRSARGALANVLEHSGADRAAVTLTYQSDTVSLDVRDDGRGFEPGLVNTGGARGRGLPGIRGRVEQFGGSLFVESVPGEGTALAVSIPLPAPVPPAEQQ